MERFERFVETPTQEALRETYGGLVVRALMDEETPPSPDSFLESSAKTAAILSPKDLWQTRQALRTTLLVGLGRPQTDEQKRKYLRILMEQYNEEEALKFHQKIQEAAKQRKGQ